ncbi:tetratricopeptide repeat protein [Aureisphaera galaxeae]|uniref:tetratricopeptide repeat-containing sensor histidine kinase n=1 Tax=Aureisphaera galaxeae TaxID=1538023 RepID=UPI00235023A7|nr:tetratricopeptide repeat-containing sensor histidine kinase [Aureisphaera galaxeae]MDC8005774.1 tetratricopeptide repeat protein [Aureisphaera galaxeae]
MNRFIVKLLLNMNLICEKFQYPLGRVAIFGLVLLFLAISVSCDATKKSDDEIIEYGDVDADSTFVYIYKAKEKGLSKDSVVQSLSRAGYFIDGIGNDSLKVKALVDLGIAWFGARELDSFYTTSKRLDLFSRDIGDSLGIARSYYNFGSYHLRRQQMDSAYQSFFLAERLYARLKDYKWAGRAALTMAIIQKNIRDYVGSEANSIRAINHLEKADDTQYLASANNNLGLISNELGKYDEAIEYHTMVLENRRELGKNALVVGSLNNIGLVYASKEDYAEAIRYYNSALSHDSIMKSKPSTQARLWDNLARAKALSGQTEGIPDLFYNALSIREKEGDNLGVATSNLHLAEYFLNTDSISKAYDYAKTAYEKSKPLKYNRGVLESLDILVKTGSTENALKFSKIRIHIMDSLQNEERGFREQFARIRYETDKIESENIRVTRQKRQLTILLLALVASFSLVYTLIQRRSNRKELQFREAQQKANEDIYNLMLQQQEKLEEGKRMEKNRISEELHDGVLGRLFGTRLNLDSLNESQDQGVIDKRANYIDELKNIEDEIRRISHNLSTNVFEKDVFFIEVIENLIEDQSKLEQQNGLLYHFNNDPKINWEKMPNAIKVHLYRIIQEGLQNIRKHAKAGNAWINFKREDQQLALSIVDDGQGFSAGDRLKKGIGMKNISSRVKQIGGTVNFSSKNRKGTTILVKIKI